MGAVSLYVVRITAPFLSVGCSIVWTVVILFAFVSCMLLILCSPHSRVFLSRAFNANAVRILM